MTEVQEQDEVVTIQVHNGDYERAAREAAQVGIAHRRDVHVRTVARRRGKPVEEFWAVARADGTVVPITAPDFAQAPSTGVASGRVIVPGSPEHRAAEQAEREASMAADLDEARREDHPADAPDDLHERHPYSFSTGDAPEDMAAVIAELNGEEEDEPPAHTALPDLVGLLQGAARHGDLSRQGSPSRGLMQPTAPDWKMPRTLYPPAAPIPAPSRPSVRDLVAGADTTGAEKATEGWRAVLGLPAGTTEQGRRKRRRVIARDLDGPKLVTVVNVKGGGRKTTVTRQLAYTLGKHRGGGTLAIDFNETHGNLIERVHRTKDTTIKDLLEDLSKFEGNPDAKIGDLAPYINGQDIDQFDVLASDADPTSDFVIGMDQTDRILNLTARFWKVRLADTGNNWRAPHYGKILERTDQLVIVSEVAEDAASGAAWLVDALRYRPQYEHLVNHAVTILSDTTGRQDRALVGKLQRHFKAHTRSVHVVPYDPALKGGKRIVQSQLSPRTVDAWEIVGADVVEGL